ncbi:PREDICTED: uncharacterized protein LOC104825600 [Tarenaya hassleriana]|uniref:uncharacterized protein LOC104825600 n=1 Tax=Tarenaya hassleriana TaxID=28532 RepID=UPI00053C53F0|nr:PREDICTED: uncharacterized protein LOC104825600 [Tarenaya hassleriana]
MYLEHCCEVKFGCLALGDPDFSHNCMVSCLDSMIIAPNSLSKFYSTFYTPRGWILLDAKLRKENLIGQINCMCNFLLLNSKPGQGCGRALFGCLTLGDSEFSHNHMQLRKMYPFGGFGGKMNDYWKVNCLDSMINAQQSFLNSKFCQDFEFHVRLCYSPRSCLLKNKRNTKKKKSISLYQVRGLYDLLIQITVPNESDMCFQIALRLGISRDESGSQRFSLFWFTCSKSGQ